MHSLWNDADRRSILARIDSVTDASAPRWGKMTADRMLSHLTAAMQMSSGELAVREKKLPLRFFPLKQLAIYVLPFAKGLPTAPELLSPPAAPVSALKGQLTETIERFAARRDAPDWPRHPAFGTLTPRAWGVLTYRHIDHHLRQFGA